MARTTTRLKCLVTVLGLGTDLKKKPLEINPDIYKHVLKLDFSTNYKPLLYTGGETPRELQKKLHSINPRLILKNSEKCRLFYCNLFVLSPQLAGKGCILKQLKYDTLSSE